ncbi:hypothetical protein SY83_12905 [Paenibacillus swuensis]|uniref:Uncharacterized protein n=1 Tax=Paenibacillus swuensis TaxID=1178515 RepID=A0A172TIX4_9BACL|nr:hypothetical protein [Paenibacillus swuensis]ANE47019.1 hypothetical protein SY83_12905 [Paenibacillus swuensis]
MSTTLLLIMTIGYVCSLLVDRKLFREVKPSGAVRGTYYFLNGIFLVLWLMVLLDITPMLPTQFIIRYVSPWFSDLLHLRH